MNLRIEILGRVFYVELSKAEAAQPEPEAEQAIRPPDTAPQPMVVYEGVPREPLGFHSGGLERDRADTLADPTAWPRRC